MQPRDEVHIFLMVATLSVCAYITSIKEAADGGAFIGSHLLGAFVAGMCFVNVPRSQAIWNSQMKRVVKWMVRFFFASSVGFAVPVSEMFTLESFGNGLLLAIGPTITTKLFSGIFAYTRYTSPEAKARAAKASWITKYCHAQPQQLLVGAAMVARGEFAYMVADTAQSLTYEGGEPGQRMLSPGIYASVVWVLPQHQSAPACTAAHVATSHRSSSPPACPGPPPGPERSAFACVDAEERLLRLALSCLPKSPTALSLSVQALVMATVADERRIIREAASRNEGQCRRNASAAIPSPRSPPPSTPPSSRWQLLRRARGTFIPTPGRQANTPKTHLDRGFGPNLGHLVRICSLNKAWTTAT